MAYFAMSKLALKWALKKPPTTKYPFVPRTPIARSRGKLVFTKDNCVYCNICHKKCPTKAILVTRPSKQWAVDHLRCITCGACVDACPKKCLELSTSHGNAAVSKQKEQH